MEADEFIEIAKERQELAELAVGWYVVQRLKSSGEFANAASEAMKDPVFTKYKNYLLSVHEQMRNGIREHERQKAS